MLFHSIRKREYTIQNITVIEFSRVQSSQEKQKEIARVCGQNRDCDFIDNFLKENREYRKTKHTKQRRGFALRLPLKNCGICTITGSSK